MCRKPKGPTNPASTLPAADTAIHPAPSTKTSTHFRDTTSSIQSSGDSLEGPVIVTTGMTTPVQASTEANSATTVSVRPSVIVRGNAVNSEGAGLGRLDEEPRTVAVLGSLSSPVAVDVTVNVSRDFDLREGTWFVTTLDNKLQFDLRAQDSDNRWEMDFKAEKGEINPFPGQGTVEFKLVREAGTMNFKGQFDGQQGFGHFVFTPDPGYFTAIGKLGVEDLSENREYSYFLLNIKKEYVSMLQRDGFSPLHQHELLSLSAMHVDEAFIKYWKTYGFSGQDEVRSLIRLKSLHIDSAYVNDLKAAGYDHLDIQQLIRLKSQHIDGNYVRSMGAANSGSPISPDELTSYKALHIDSGYLASLKKVGYDNLSRSEIRSLFASNVTASFIKQFQDAGYTNVPAYTLVSLKRSGVDADYVAKMKEKGFNTTDLNKYIRLKRDFN